VDPQGQLLQVVAALRTRSGVPNPSDRGEGQSDDEQANEDHQHHGNQAAHG
jgi:hypothetical protein